MARFLSICLVAALSLFLHSTAFAADDNGFFVAFDHRLDQHQWFLSNGWTNGNHQSCEWRATSISIEDNHLQMKFSDHGGVTRPLGCSEMQTTSRLGYGLYEARMRVAAGSGLNTAFFTYVGPPVGVPEHDEIDFEFLGKDTHFVQINYFTNAEGHHEVMVPLGFDASTGFHDYAIEWTPTKIRWYVDGKPVHETPDGAKLPRNAPRLYLSLWSGSSVEDSWLGPLPPYTAPVTADVEWTGYTPSGKPCQFPQSLRCK